MAGADSIHRETHNNNMEYNIITKNITLMFSVFMKYTVNLFFLQNSIFIRSFNISSCYVFAMCIKM